MNDSSPHLSQSLLATLAPSLGFFGGAALDHLDVAIDRDLVSLKILIDINELAYLNLRGIEFRAANRATSLDDLDLRVSQSSVQKNAPERRGTALLDKRGIHTAKELRPSWEINFGKSVRFSGFRLFNRTDGWSRRSRYLVVEATGTDGRSFELYRAQSFNNLSRSLETARKLLSIDPPQMDRIDVGIAENWRNKLMRELSARASCQDTCIDPRSWVDLMVFTRAWVQGEPTEEELLVYTGFLLDQKKLSPRFATSVKLLAAALPSRNSLDRLSALMTDVANQRGMKPVMLTRHGIRPEGVLRSSAQAYMTHLKEVAAKMNAIGYPVVIAYGTLLGAIRDARFIAHDDDLDVLYKASGKNRAEVAREVETIAHRLRDEGFIVTHMLPKHLNMHVADACSRRSIDVFPCWSEGGKLQMHMEGMAIRGIAPEIMFPAGVVRLEGEFLPAPAQPIGFLEERYGKGWRVPDPYYDWPWKLR